MVQIHIAPTCKGHCLLPGPSRRLAPVIKCNAFLCFQSYIVGDISLTEIYRWLVTFIEISSAILKSARSQEKDYSFLDDTFPSLYDVLVYEQKLESEYLERQIYERSLKSEPSIVKLIEKISDLSKLSTLSEPSIMKFIENQHRVK